MRPPWVEAWEEERGTMLGYCGLLLWFSLGSLVEIKCWGYGIVSVIVFDDFFSAKLGLF